MLFQYIQKNKRKTIALFIGFIIFTGLIGSAFGVWISKDTSQQTIVLGFFIALIIGLFYAYEMYVSSSEVIMHLNNAHLIDAKKDFPELWNIIEELSIVAQVPMPKIYLINDPSPNAFATGPSPKKAAVAVTTGLVERLNRQELEAVMAHEMTHVRNYDIRLQSLAVALTAVISLIASYGTSFWAFGFGSNNNNSKDNRSNSNIFIILLSFLLLVLGPIAATLVQLSISRNREYIADAGAVELTRNPQAMIDALLKISGSPAMKRNNVDDATASLYFASPFRKKDHSDLFATHPTIEKRINAIKNL